MRASTDDIEDGYSDDPEAVAALAEAVAHAGAVGINLEDGSGDPERLAAKDPRDPRAPSCNAAVRQRRAYTAAQQAAAIWLGGDPTPLFEPGLDFATLNGLFA